MINHEEDASRASSFSSTVVGEGPNQQVVTKVITGEIVIEGYLKKMKKYLISSKNYYRVIGTSVLLASNPKKQFTEKYDLTNYTVQLS